MGRKEYYNSVVSQFQNQYSYINQLAFKRNDIMKYFNELQNISVNDVTQSDKYVISSRHVLTQSFDLLISDSKKWGKPLPQYVQRDINELVKHIIHTLLHLDIVKDSYNGDSNSCVYNIEPNFNIRSFLTDVIIPDISAFTKEKFGVCPLVHIEGNADLKFAMPALIEYVFIELFKNSMESIINKYGALNIEDEEYRSKN
jgi:hypothetical protein